MIYLDSAATTFQKPAAVQRAVVPGDAHDELARRGGYAAAQQPTSCCFAAAAQPRSSSPCRRASRSFSR